MRLDSKHNTFRTPTKYTVEGKCVHSSGEKGQVLKAFRGSAGNSSHLTIDFRRWAACEREGKGQMERV